MKRHLLLLLAVVFLSCCKGVQAPMPAHPGIPVTMAPTGDLGFVGITTSCLATTKGYPEAGKLSGRLILSSEGDTYYLSLENGAKTPVTKNSPSGLISDIKVSPDFLWVAYLDEDSTGERFIVVQSTQTQTKYTFQADSDEWDNIAYWLDHENIVLWKHASPLDSLILLNPFTGATQTLENSYPDILPEDIEWDSNWPSITIYSPTLNNLVYVAKGGLDYQLGYHKLVLWDLKQEKPLSEIGNYGYSLVRPLWKSDGSGVLFVKPVVGYTPQVEHDEIFYMGVNGSVEKLTDLQKYYAYAKILAYSWSPDEKYLALVVRNSFIRGEEQKNKLLVLDISTLEVMDYCIVPDRFTPLIWSPNSHQLSYYISISGKPRVMVVDIMERYMIELGEDLYPLGWIP